MQKPLTVAYAEFNKQLTELINGSGLPAFVILTSLKSVSGELEKIAAQQYQRDSQSFYKDVSKEESDNIKGQE